ncbi:protein involved in cell wall biogenesis and architecture [Scheffersomyces stipitis CBS 6054]|uniref:3-methyl-2-oxobutanoate hydroxymethyltransferase n=1 Tax=Scheffersomyces stipitis (strain ATCC 58785 / CBS 6054 / NBRC 10063 / NRRL Y-11545) TaxID=322104 RepID=A3GFD5_PICST|nr:protein involved in cell wall biogenesis and architecture [Scheffersomyces stipitis CBS 6054]EAZ63737.2 protein involved in cell wall biogenesis and architecture [Scheffersomyces stipitis CBS 6054]
MSSRVQIFRRTFSSSVSAKSSYTGTARKTVADINRFYASSKPITVVTAHDFITAKMVDHAGIDICLIGDSLANTTLGLDDTNELEFQEMLYHVKSVQRGNDSSLIVADLPFGSYEKSSEQALDTAMTIIKHGKIQGVKVEGGDEFILPTVNRLTTVGIPVMGHVGLTPQKHNALGGYRLQGNSVENAVSIYKQCLDLQRAGVFSIVLECIPNKLAQYITENLSVPTIGIGAGPFTSGQVLVISDILGMKSNKENHKPKFVRAYEDFYTKGVEALTSYGEHVENAQFPDVDEHGYKIKRDVFEEFKKQAHHIH